MASFLDRALTEGNPYEEARKAAEHLRELFPCLHALLTGIEPAGAIPGLAPGGVRIYSNGGVLKAMFSGDKWENIAYLDCGPRLTSFQEIEDAINAGKIVWKKATDRKHSYLNLPH